MPLTFIDIERQKSWRIWAFFLILVLLYFIVTAVFTSLFLPLSVHASAHFWIFAGVIALFVAGIHFLLSAYDTVNTVIRGLSAQPPDPKDDIHKMLTNIMEEIHVVTGNQRKMQCVVIPSLSMNALAAADLKGAAVIGITEGLLSRLTRPQLEAVIAHEAHHILSGDCLEATVAASLFGTYAAALENLSDTSSGRTFSSPAFLLAGGLLKLSSLLNMFISREREYRADAASVRMTRNPLALAETLYLLSRSWRGAGFIGSGYEMLCIVNPQVMALDETEGFWADLLSTHPPIRKRLDILLAMARVNITELVEKTKKRAEDTQKPSQPTYYAMNPQQQWQGPFNMADLGALPWLSPLTWITTGDRQAVERAWKEPLINEIFASRLVQKEDVASEFTCPSCRQPLVMESYEGTQVYQCRFCSGTLVENSKIPRIIARTGRERPCSERMSALAKTVVKENQMRYTRQKLVADSGAKMPLLACPKCKNPMSRGFYSLAYLIEIDRCSFCGLTWFDRDELEMLQCLIESEGSLGQEPQDVSV
ncbi:MAG TPA: M48 family metalloprotease [Nitrospirota bacterium]|nr:M48 family metalloprotease [Nitrospirota bacterium]